jgi:hypothetical protein
MEETSNTTVCGSSVSKRILQNVVGLGKHLVGASPRIGSDPVFFPEFHRGNIGIDIAVSQEDYVMLRAVPVVLGYEVAFHDIVLVLRDEKTLQQAEGRKP